MTQNGLNRLLNGIIFSEHIGFYIIIFFWFYFWFRVVVCLQCFDAVGWAAGRACGL